MNKNITQFTWIFVVISLVIGFTIGFVIGNAIQTKENIAGEARTLGIQQTIKPILGTNSWQKTFGGSGNDFGNSVQPTSDGGYIIAGTITSVLAGATATDEKTGSYSTLKSENVYLIKTDSAGTQTWAKMFGDSDSDRGYSVQQTIDGGYILIRGTDAGAYRACLIKTDSQGNKEWEKTFATYENSIRNCRSVRQTTDGGYILTGPGSNGVSLVKMDSSGTKLWEQTETTAAGESSSVQQTSEGGYVIAGEIFNYVTKKPNVLLVKTDALGNKLWEKTFGGSGYNYGYSVQQTVDEGFVIVGSSTDLGSTDVYLIKTDLLGNTEWEKTFGGSGFDVGTSVQQTSDGGYVITGQITLTSGGVNDDVYLIKTDSLGNKEWEKTFGGSDIDVGKSVRQTSDGSYIIAGSTSSYGTSSSGVRDYDVFLIKYTPEKTISPISKFG